MKRPVIALVSLLLLASPAYALVVGRGGVVYPIKEKDLLEVIEERAARIDPDALRKKWQAQIEEEARTFRPEDAVSGLPPAGKDELYRVDLSFTVTAALAKSVTDINGVPLYPEGLRVNPLKIMADKGLSYPFVIVVINAERPAEVRWFQKSGYNDDPRVKLLISDGYPYVMALKLTRPVYQLTRIVRDRFQLRATPSLVFWPMGTETLAVRTVRVSDSQDSQDAPQGDTPVPTEANHAP